EEPHMVQESAEMALTVCNEQGYAYYLSWATIMQGWALTSLGQGEAGITRMRDGMAAMQATGAALRRPYYLALLATACGQVGRVEEGLSLLTQALTMAEQTGENWSLAELYRRKGDLLLNSIRFHNNSTPRYQEAAAKLAWERTIAFFKTNLS